MSDINTLSVFQKRFKECLKEKKMTQEEIAEKLNLSHETVKGYMRKKANNLPPLDTLKQISLLLEVDVAYLLGEIDCKKWVTVKVKAETGLSENAIETLKSQLDESEKEWQASLYSSLDDRMAEMLMKHTPTENEETISKLPQPQKTFALEYLRHLQNPCPTINTLSQIIEHPKFEELLLKIMNSQYCYNQCQRSKQNVKELEEKLHSAKKESLYENPFDDEYGKEWLPFEEEIFNEKLHDKENFYLASLYEVSNIFNQIVRDLCEIKS